MKEINLNRVKLLLSISLMLLHIFNIILMYLLYFFIAVEIYLSPIETHCSNIDYFPTIEAGSDSEETTRLHLARGVIVLFVLSFLSVIFAFFTGLSGEAHYIVHNESHFIH